MKLCEGFSILKSLFFVFCKIKKKNQYGWIKPECFFVYIPQNNINEPIAA